MHDRDPLPSPFRVDAADGGDDPIGPFRFDRISMDLLQSRQRDDGSWLLQGRASRVGILKYMGPTGPIREYVPPETLSDPESLAGLCRCVVTLEHPLPLGTMVGRHNVGALQVGDVGGDDLAPGAAWDAEGGYVVISVCVRREDAINAIRRGKVELSAGYKPVIDPTPGVDPIHGAYDARQVKRRYNHVAITDTGRAGHDVRLRTDSAGNQITEDTMLNANLLRLAILLGITRTDTEEHIAADAPAAIEKLKAEVPTEAAAAGSALEEKVKKLTADLAQAMADLEAERAAAGAGAIADKINAACDAPPPADIATADAEAVKMDSIRKVVRARGADRARMEKVADGLRVDAAEVAKLGDAGLRKLLVTTAMPKARQDADDAYYAARLDAMLEDAPRLDSDPNAEMSRRAAEALNARAAVRVDTAGKKPLTPSQRSLAAMRGKSAEAAE